MKNNLKKKTWVKNKKQVYNCGQCDWCNKELTSDMGGWIINAEKKHFCHDGVNKLCFDHYLDSRKPISQRRKRSAA